MSTTLYVWDVENDSLIEELDGSGNSIVTYSQTPNQFGGTISEDRGGSTSYYHYDGLGSTLALSNQSGVVTDEYSYSAYGEVVASSGSSTNPFKYVGKYGYYTDSETNDIYIRARTYQPTVARWYSRDPVGQLLQNWYSYCKSKAVCLLDPSGATWIDPNKRNSGTPLDELPPILPTLLPSFPANRTPAINPRITRTRFGCDEFLGVWRSSSAGLPPDHPALGRAQQCNANIFCSPTGCNFGAGGAQTFCQNGYCQICLDGRAQMSTAQWFALLTHEAVHVNQMSSNCGCPGIPYAGPKPRVPSLKRQGKPTVTDCENCITNETEAYRAQAEILFPNDQDSQLQFIDAGVASSCQFRCSQWAKQEDRPLAPEYDPPFVF